MQKSHRAYVLCSGGIDSTTTLAQARSDFPESDLFAVSVDYGQRHAKEMDCAKIQAANYNATHYTLPMRGLMGGMLVDKGEDNEAVPDVSYADLPEGMSPTYVSFRNGLMLSALAAQAQSWILEGKDFEDRSADLYIGVHADDGVNWAYPDCTNEFIGAMSAAIYVGTYHKVRVRAPLIFMTKADIVDLGNRLDVDYSNTWSCYKGEDLHCGVCPTCRSRKEAFELSFMTDPTEYAA